MYKSSPCREYALFKTLWCTAKQPIRYSETVICETLFALDPHADLPERTVSIIMQSDSPGWHHAHVCQVHHRPLSLLFSLDAIFPQSISILLPIAPQTHCLLLRVKRCYLLGVCVPLDFFNRGPYSPICFFYILKMCCPYFLVINFCFFDLRLGSSNI